MSVSKRSLLVSVLAGAAIAASLLTLTPVAQAASLTTTQIAAITGLLKSFNADPAAIAKVEAVLSGTATSTPSIKPMPPRACPSIVRHLKIGSSGSDVSGLQEFLGGDVTGYFGPKTAERVKHWQIEHGVIATGTPATGGAGVIGPKTRVVLVREMQKFCGIGQFRNDSSATSTATSIQQN